MAETLSRQVHTLLDTVSDRDYVEAIAGLLSITTTYYSIVSDYNERQHALSIIRGCIDKWLETIAPLEYIPGLVDELDRIVDKPLWDAIPVLTEGLFEKILVETKVFKEKTLVGSEYDDVVMEAIADTYRVHTILLLESLSNRDIDWSEYPVLSSILWSSNDPCDQVRKLATVNALAIVLSLNNG